MGTYEDSPNLHRGRLQAQGGGVEKSEPWAQPNALTLSQGLEKLALLEAKLTPKEGAARNLGVQQARRFMMNAAAHGGVGPTKVSFPKRNPIRIDVEVLAGMAFVPD
jgi:hypothetical protein